MKTITTISDIGCIKLFTKDVSFYFRNNFGDVENTVNIYEEPDRPGRDFNFAGSFDVQVSGKTFLAKYDCERQTDFTFTKTGRYFVYLNDKDAMPVFHIQWIDDAI